jgi:hypothetical protein
MLPKIICKLKAISIKMPGTYFTELEKNPTIHVEPQKPQITKATLNTKNNAGSIKMPDFKM